MFFLFWNKRLHKDNIRLKLRSPQVLHCLWTDDFCYQTSFCYMSMVFCYMSMVDSNWFQYLHWYRLTHWSPVSYTSDHSKLLIFKQRLLPVSCLAHKSAWSMASIALWFQGARTWKKILSKVWKNPDFMGKLWFALPEQPNTANFKLGIHLS